MKKRLVALTGAGISAESGISTFRDSDGLWERHSVEDVASIEGWHRNRELVLRFYNARRAQLKDVEPNVAHKILALLEDYYDVCIVTQNVDNLHERAHSSNIIHLHGELTKARGEVDTETIIDVGYEPITLGQKAPDGTQLRPHIVWFGEAVPMIEKAAQVVEQADVLLVIGTSLNVYPAAGLVNFAPNSSPIYLIDPKPSNYQHLRRYIHVIAKKASEGMQDMFNVLVPKQ